MFKYFSHMPHSEILKKYAEIWSGIKYQIKKINNDKLGKYGKYYMKINLILMIICL